LGTPALADDAADRDAVAGLMKATFDKPESPLAVDPISVEGDYAVAGWTQGEIGGRALLRRKHGNWALVLCSGESLKTAAALYQAGLPKEVADHLAVEIAAAETDSKRIAMFDSFEGTVMMDGEGNHPDAGHQHGHE
jgi:hypothetical protein